jgi:hypothetical protein
MCLRVFKCCFLSLPVRIGEKYPDVLVWSMIKIGLRSLVVCATVALILLTIFSDLTPHHVEGFEDAVKGGPVSVDCIVIHCNHTKSGFIMTALDQNGDQASIFLAQSVLNESVAAGSAVRLAVTPSDDDPNFLFASSAEVLSHPG